MQTVSSKQDVCLINHRSTTWSIDDSFKLFPSLFHRGEDTVNVIQFRHKQYSSGDYLSYILRTYEHPVADLTCSNIGSSLGLPPPAARSNARATRAQVAQSSANSPPVNATPNSTSQRSPEANSSGTDGGCIEICCCGKRGRGEGLGRAIKDRLSNSWRIRRFFKIVVLYVTEKYFTSTRATFIH